MKANPLKHLAASLLAVLFGVTAAAQTSGSCGDNLTWSYNSSTRTLTITGTGAMNSYTLPTQPWVNYRTNITSVSLPAGLTSIGDHAFDECENLTSATIPSGVTAIGQYAFSGCKALTSVTIPSGVTAIAQCTFSGCLNLASVTLPEGVTTIGDYAFRDCHNLTSINLPSSVTTIKPFAFEYCLGLTSVTIPSGVATIGRCAFMGCSGLTSVSIPEGVTSIESDAFNGCSALTTVTVLNPTPVAIASTVFSSRTIATLWVPYGCAGDYQAADYWKEFRHIYEIQPTSGQCGENLTWSYDADSCKLTITGYGAMTDYKRADLPWASYVDQITYISLPDGLTHIGNYAFRDCRNLSSASLPSRLKSIGLEAFRNCQNITAITLPDSLTAIDRYAFYGCSKLDMVRAEMTTPFAFGSSAFASIKSTCKLIVPIGTLDAYTTAGWTSDVFKGGVEELLEGQCGDNLTWRLDQATGLLTITGSGAMTDFSSSTDVPWSNYKESITSVSLPAGLTTIGKYAFFEAANLASIDLPENLTTIGNYAFMLCSKLTSISIPSGVTTIGTQAFAGCSKLSSVALPDSLTEMGLYAFQGCLELTSIAIPSGVTAINQGTFQECGLTTLTLPENITSIADYAFYDCIDLGEVRAKMPEPFAFGASAFDKIGATCKLIVPRGTLDAYLAAGWTDEVFKGGVEETPGGSCGPNLTWTYDTETHHLTITGTGAMNNFGSERNKPWYRYQYDITSVSLPDGLTSIGGHAFSTCHDLASINIPESVTSIGRLAFVNCRSLTSITLPEGVTVLDYCFASCSSLTSITLPANVTYISEAFSSCSALTTVKALMTEPCTLGTNAFSEISPACKLIIPAGTRQAYINAGWTTDIFPGGIVELGDANLDGTVSITDVGLMIDCILGSTPAGFDADIADANQDGIVSITDVGLVIDAILSQGSAGVKQRRPAVEAMDDMRHPQ